MSPLSPKEQEEAVRRWWRSLQPIELEGRKLPGDRAALARLRRCSSTLEAAAEPTTAQLLRQIYPAASRGLKLALLPRVAVLAAVLAYVRDDDTRETNIARKIGRPRASNGSTAVLSPVRLKRLLATRTDDELLIAFRRVVALVDKTANVRDLARLLLNWTDDERGGRTRTRFAFDYHDASGAAPRLEMDSANHSDLNNEQKD